MALVNKLHVVDETEKAVFLCAFGAVNTGALALLNALVILILLCGTIESANAVSMPIIFFSVFAFVQLVLSLVHVNTQAGRVCGGYYLTTAQAADPRIKINYSIKAHQTLWVISLCQLAVMLASFTAQIIVYCCQRTKIQEIDKRLQD